MPKLGYGLVDGRGQIVNGADEVAAEHQNDASVAQKILLPDERARDLEECTQYRASRVFYTGTENCFTAIAKAPVDLKSVIDRESGVNDKKQNKDDIDRIVIQPGEMDLGPGAKHTNASWLGANATFAMKTLAGKNLPNPKPKRD